MAKLAKELLPALDNLDRALEAAAEEDPLLEGVRLVRAELARRRARGHRVVRPEGERFDPSTTRRWPSSRSRAPPAARSSRSISPGTG